MGQGRRTPKLFHAPSGTSLAAAGHRMSALVLWTSKTGPGWYVDYTGLEEGDEVRIQIDDANVAQTVRADWLRRCGDRH